MGSRRDTPGLSKNPPPLQLCLGSRISETTFGAGLALVMGWGPSSLILNAPHTPVCWGWNRSWRQGVLGLSQSRGAGAGGSGVRVACAEGKWE